MLRPGLWRTGLPILFYGLPPAGSEGYVAMFLAAPQVRCEVTAYPCVSDNHAFTRAFRVVQGGHDLTAMHPPAGDRIPQGKILQ